MESFQPRSGGKEVLVLIIEDEKVSRRALAMLLAGSGYFTEAFASAEEALAALANGERPRIAVVDLDLPGMSGAEFLEYLARVVPVVRPVVVSAANEERLARLALSKNVKYLRKPIRFPELLAALDENLA